MQARSAAFDEAVRKGGVVTARLEVLQLGSPVAEITPADAGGAGLIEGDVTVDTAATSRRTFRARIADPTGAWIPTRPADMLSVVSGHELRVWRGWRYADGTEELLSQGIYTIGEALPVDGPGLAIELSGEDRSRVVRDNTWVKAYSVGKGRNVIQAAMDIISDRRPGTEFTGMDTTSTLHTTPYLPYAEQADPMAAVAQILGAAGLEGFFDVNGRFLIRPIPEAANADPVWDYDEGQTSTMLSIKGSGSRGDIFNGVVAVGENTYGISPARAELWDTDPNSPTYYRGPFGRKPKFLPPNPAITTNAMALAAAAGELRRTLRLEPAYSVTVMPHPAHEGGDVAHLRRARLRVDDSHVLQRFSLPLGAKGRSELTLRKVLTAA